ncbi:MAG: Y-family DNA polymerase [Bacteroidales bacterium]
MFALSDCNNFFVSCERVFNPSLNGRPVVVLSSNDGCVISRSNEAKSIGIKMGQPFFQIQDLVRKYNVEAFSTNFILYGDMSHRVMSTLREMVPAIEIYSIDEAFLNLSGIAGDKLDEFSHSISSKVKQNTGIPVSVGVAPTKTLAKIASKLCKQYPKLNGACYMHRPEDIEKVLKKFPIDDVWGVGRKYSKLLNDFGVFTAYDFTQRKPLWVKQKMSIVGLRTWNELRGIACIDFETVPCDRQQISVSRSFAKEISDFDELHQAVSSFAVLCAEKLRGQNSVCGEMNVFIFTNRFRTDLPQQYRNKIVQFEVLTNSSLEIVECATKALKQIFTIGFGYKKAGVILSGIMPKNGEQLAFFDTVDRDKHAKLMTTLDNLNQVEGRNTVVFAAQGVNKLKLNREHLSPSYSTNLDDIIKVIV